MSRLQLYLRSSHGKFVVPYSTKNASEKRDARRLDLAPAADAIDEHRSAIGRPCAVPVAQSACGFGVDAKDSTVGRNQWSSISRQTANGTHLFHLIVQASLLLAASTLGDRLQRRSDLLHALVKVYCRTHISLVVLPHEYLRPAYL